MRTHQRFLPILPQLKNVVENHTVVDLDGQFYQDRLLPDGKLELLFPLGEAEISNNGKKVESVGAFLGQLDGHSDCVSTKKGRLIFTKFQPWVEAGFFSEAPKDFFCDSLPLELAWGGAVLPFVEKLHSIEGLDFQLQTIEALIWRVVSKRKHAFDTKMKAIVVELLQNRIGFSVKGLSKKFGVSRRHLHQKFIDSTGLSPMQFYRHVRLRKVLKELNRYNNEENSLTQLAYQLNYFDQAHFIHDFKKLTGFSPGLYLKKKRLSPTCLEKGA